MSDPSITEARRRTDAKRREVSAMERAVNRITAVAAQIQRDNHYSDRLKIAYGGKRK